MALFIIVGCFYYLSAAINPFLYSLLSKRFRRGFCDLQTRVKRHIFQNHVDSNTLNVQRQFISVPTRNTHSLPRSRNLLLHGGIPKLASHELSTSSPGRMQTVSDEVEVNRLDSKARKIAPHDKTFNKIYFKIFLCNFITPSKIKLFLHFLVIWSYINRLCSSCSSAINCSNKSHYKISRVAVVLIKCKS